MHSFLPVHMRLSKGNCFPTDAFDVPSLKSHKNYHHIYSAQGHTHLSSYRYIHKTPDGQEFTFIAVDATPMPGAKRPFNFFGMLSEVGQCNSFFCFKILSGVSLEYHVMFI